MSVDLIPIPGFPGYSITRDGRVWSEKTSRRWKTGRWLTLVLSADGYPRVNLTLSGKKAVRTVHRLVWLAFKGTIPPEKQIDHIDRDKLNNALSNLRLVSITQNKLNSSRYKNSSSGHKGVYQNKQFAERGYRSWLGVVTHQHVQHRTPHFHTKEEALQAVKILRERVCGEFAYHE